MSAYNINPLYPKPSTGSTGTPVAAQALAVAGSVVQFAAFNVNTSLVAVDVQGGSVYITFDGTSPSAGHGHIGVVGQNYLWSRATAQAAKFIQNSGSSTLFASEFQV